MHGRIQLLTTLAAKVLDSLSTAKGLCLTGMITLCGLKIENHGQLQKRGQIFVQSENCMELMHLLSTNR